MWVEAGRRGHCLCLPQPYAAYRLSLNSATRPRDIMDVYRFIAGSCEFDRDVLGIYRLPQGEKAGLEARIHATRKRLRALALLGEFSQVCEELRWLNGLGARAHFREYLLSLFAMLTRPGSFAAPIRRWLLLAWHALSRGSERTTASSVVTRTNPESIESSV